MSRRMTRDAKKKEEELQRKADKEYRAERRRRPRAKTEEELAREKFMQAAKEPEYKVPDDFGDFDEAYEDELVEDGLPDFRDEEDRMIDDLAEMDTDEMEDIPMEGLDDSVSLRF